VVDLGRQDLQAEKVFHIVQGGSGGKVSKLSGGEKSRHRSLRSCSGRERSKEDSKSNHLGSQGGSSQLKPTNSPCERVKLRKMGRGEILSGRGTLWRVCKREEICLKSGQAPSLADDNFKNRGGERKVREGKKVKGLGAGRWVRHVQKHFAFDIHEPILNWFLKAS